MSRIIIINSKRVYLTGQKYKSYSEDFKSLQARLRKVLSNIEGYWSGSDNKNFCILFEDYIESLSDISTFLLYAFAIVYFFTCLTLLFKKKITFSNVTRKYKFNLDFLN